MLIGGFRSCYYYRYVSYLRYMNCHCYVSLRYMSYHRYTSYFRYMMMSYCYMSCYANCLTMMTMSHLSSCCPMMSYVIPMSYGSPMMMSVCCWDGCMMSLCCYHVRCSGESSRYGCYLWWLRG